MSYNLFVAGLSEAEAEAEAKAVIQEAKALNESQI